MNFFRSFSVQLAFETNLSISRALHIFVQLELNKLNIFVKYKLDDAICEHLNNKSKSEKNKKRLRIKKKTRVPLEQFYRMFWIGPSLSW